MARQTHPPPSSGPVPGLGRRRSVFDFRGQPQRGAAEGAPTAPHATAPVGRDKSGPARFWSRRRVRLALNLSLAFSLAVHLLMTPWRLLPDTSGIELKDVDEELTIPIDFIGEAPAAPTPAPPAPAVTSADDHKKGPNASKLDAGKRHLHAADAGAPDAAHARDGGVLAADGGAPVDAGQGSSDGGALVASADAGARPGASGPRDPGAMIGLSNIVKAGPVNVTLLMNVATIRKNPVGARIGPLLYAIPQWHDFMKGSPATVDPIKHIEWILIYGPSLIHTERDAVFVRYSISDAVVDHAVEAIAKSYAKGGPFDVGIPGVKASLGHADDAQRVFVRPQSKLLVIVPPDKARAFAKVYHKRSPRGPVAGEALRLTVRDPWKQIAIPGLHFSKGVHEIRLWVVPDASGGADVYAEGECQDEATAADTAKALTDLIRRQNSFLIRAATGGLLNGARVVPEGKKATLHIHATPHQLELLLNNVSAYMGAGGPPP